jgi:hypothetical protein
MADALHPDAIERANLAATAIFQASVIADGCLASTTRSVLVDHLCQLVGVAYDALCSSEIDIAELRRLVDGLPPTRAAFSPDLA